MVGTITEILSHQHLRGILACPVFLHEIAVDRRGSIIGLEIAHSVAAHGIYGIRATD